MHRQHLLVRLPKRLLAIPLLLATAIGVLHVATPVRAQSVPQLAGAAMVAESSNAGEYFSTAGACDQTQESTFTFDTSGRVLGSFTGTYTESGTVVVGPRTDVSPEVMAFESAFTIQTTNGYTITGTKRLTGSRSASCLPDGPEGRRVVFSADVVYEAAITGPGGLFAVAGTAVVRATDADPGTAFPDGFNQFQETFVTSTPIELGPSSLVLEPPTATNPVETEHCVRATVRDALGHRIMGGIVRFAVTGASTESAAVELASGEARFCYDGPAEPGVDSIHAFADANGDGAEDAGEPADDATVTFVPVFRPPASLVLDPASATGPVGGEHCVTATVLNTIGGPSIGVRVHFAVSGGSTAGGSEPTGTNGTAEFCYTGPAAPATDTIRAFADTDTDGVQDTDEPSGVATATFEAVARPPASVALEPPTATSRVDAEHCVTAIVRDASGALSDPVVVQFAVSGASSVEESAETDANGAAELCYTGPAFPGTDEIRAFADTDGDGLEGSGEPAAAASATFVLPASTLGCSVTYGGRIQTSGDKATFGGNAATGADGVHKGQAGYHDHGTGLVAKDDEILAVVCDAPSGRATIYARATLAGGATTLSRVRVTDVGEPGAGVDTYALLLGSGYEAPEAVLAGGNAQVRVR